MPGPGSGVLRPRVLHVVESLDRGGLERVVGDLITAQTDNGMQCAVVCLFHLGEIGVRLSKSGVRVIELGKRTGFEWRVTRAIRNEIGEQKIDVLHTHNSMAHYYGVLASLGSGVARRINTRHGMGGGENAGRREMLYKAVLPFTDFVVAVCEEGRASFEEQGIFPRNKARVVLNGIPVGEVRAKARSGDHSLRTELGLAESALLVGNVGRLNWAKDQATLLKAFGRVRQGNENAYLVIVGEGALQKELQQLAATLGIQASVAFLGARDDVYEILGSLDLFVLSSLTEGYSIALLEACAAGLPIIATDVGGNAEIVEHERTGLLVAARSEQEIAAAISRLLRDRTLAGALGARACQWVAENGSVVSMREAYDALYAA